LMLANPRGAQPGNVFEHAPFVQSTTDAAS